MNIIYYVEVNMICICILFLFYNQLTTRFMQLSEGELVLKQLILSTIIFCFSDMIAGVLRGKMFAGARTMIEISNLVYFEALVVIAYLWMKFVHYRINRVPRFKKKIWAQLPMIFFSIVLVTNPYTNFLFFIDDKNLYVRNDGVVLHWIITYGYFVVTTIQVIWALVSEKNKLRRQEIRPLAYFLAAPLICSILQMLVYGITSSQVGVTISIVMIYLSYQSSRILTDALTGLNNRRGLDNFIREITLRYSNTNLAFLLIDLNRFKHINDEYGHGEGDRALRYAAEALKDVCKETSKSPFLCRYGGDEFVIALINETAHGIHQIEMNINEKLKEKSLQNAVPYMLSASIGTGSGICSNVEDVNNLLRIADEAMYVNKEIFRATNS